jgi:hypothetical protein
MVRRSRFLSRLPIAKVGGGVALGLVILVGAAYALSLWPFTPNGALGDGHPALKSSESPSSFLTSWLKPHERDSSAETNVGKGEAADERNAVAVPGSESAAAPANVEFWVLAASEKLTAVTRKTWAQRCEPDKQRLRMALGEEFPGLRVQSCTAGADGSVGLLRLGPAASETDPTLLRALGKVRALGDGFAQAYIKQFRKS